MLGREKHSHYRPIAGTGGLMQNQAKRWRERLGLLQSPFITSPELRQENMAYLMQVRTIRDRRPLKLSGLPAEAKLLGAPV